MFFKNKHVITSMIVAPILAIISYFAVDYYVAEVPHKAKDGQLYKMLVKSNCRWESGHCDLVNGDLELLVTSDTQEYGKNHFLLKSNTPLKEVRFSLVHEKGAHSQPESMSLVEPGNRLWQSSLVDARRSDYLQFVVSVSGSIFYAEVPAIFTYQDKDY
ncbi:MAG: hypothetical protein K0U20_07345 [Proteobacteria bacterium]|nr:hypothetical protein [Pseudomonadota bacterium]MCH9750482.1 hypothetical protein [Pseudomonadota bacterium]